MPNILASWPAPSQVQLLFGPDSDELLLSVGLRWYLWRFKTERAPIPIDFHLDEESSDGDGRALGLLKLAGSTWVVTGSGHAAEWPPSSRSQQVRLPLRYSADPKRHSSPFLAQSGDLVMAISPGEFAVKFWEPSAPPSYLRPKTTMSWSHGQPDSVVPFDGGHRVAIVTMEPNILVVDVATGRTRKIDAKPYGHPWSGVAHPTRPLLAVFSGCVSLIDLDAGRVVDRLTWFNGEKSTGVFTRGGRLLLIVTGNHLWAYEPATRACGRLMELSGFCPDSKHHAQLSPDGRTLALIHGNNEVTLVDVSYIDENFDVSTRPSGGRIASWLDGSEKGDAAVHARYGAASVVLESLYGFPDIDIKPASEGSPTLDVKTGCPACSTPWTFKATSTPGKKRPIYLFESGGGWRKSARA